MAVSESTAYARRLEQLGFCCSHSGWFYILHLYLVRILALLAVVMMVTDFRVTSSSCVGFLHRGILQKWLLKEIPMLLTTAIVHCGMDDTP